jgi:hypothetical protein
VEITEQRKARVRSQRTFPPDPLAIKRGDWNLEED